MSNEIPKLNSTPNEDPSLQEQVAQQSAAQPGLAGSHTGDIAAALPGQTDESLFGEPVKAAVLGSLGGKMVSGAMRPDTTRRLEVGSRPPIDEPKYGIARGAVLKTLIRR